MWDMDGEDVFAKRNKRVYEMIATKLGWDDFDHMKRNEQHIDFTLQKAIDLICEAHSVPKIFNI